MDDLALGKRNPQDIGAGVLFILFGIAALTFSRELEFGTTFTMGPGYVPRVLAFVLIGLGAIIAGRGLVTPGPALTPSGVRPILLVTASVLAFAATVLPLGAIVATILLVAIGAVADRESRPREVAMTAVLLAVVAVGLFVKALGVQMPILPRFV